MVFALFLGTPLTDDIYGLLAGHACYVLTEVCPDMYGLAMFTTPNWFASLFDRD
jgi:hypothetical protein